MADLPELLVGTRGLAAIARIYAEKVLNGTIEGDDTGISISRSVKVHAVRVRKAHGHGVGLDFVLYDSTDAVTLNSTETRRAFAFLHGCLSVEFGETLPDTKPAPDLTEALDLLRTAQGVMGEPSEIEGSQEWFDRADKLLGKYPQGQVGK